MATIRVEMMEGRSDWATGGQLRSEQLLAFCLHGGGRN